MSREAIETSVIDRMMPDSDVTPWGAGVYQVDELVVAFSYVSPAPRHDGGALEAFTLGLKRLARDHRLTVLICTPLTSASDVPMALTTIGRALVGEGVLDRHSFFYDDEGVTVRVLADAHRPPGVCLSTALPDVAADDRLAVALSTPLRQLALLGANHPVIVIVLGALGVSVSGVERYLLGSPCESNHQSTPVVTGGWLSRAESGNTIAVVLSRTGRHDCDLIGYHLALAPASSLHTSSTEKMLTVMRELHHLCVAKHYDGRELSETT